MNADALIDHLSELNCFVSGFDEGRSSHIDSYGTVFKFNIIESELKKIKHINSNEAWQKVVDDLSCQPCAIGSTLLGLIVKRIVLQERI